MDDLARILLDFIRAHEDWAVAVIFITAFGESFALVSLLFPGTALLIAAGALTTSGSLPYLPIMIAAILGAVLGDSLSYWLGLRFGGGVARLWPFRRNPGLLPSGIRFFERHGGKSVFIGRFFGPIRAVIPLVAGMMRMPRGRFWAANIGSAVIWAPMLLLTGDIVGTVGGKFVAATGAGTAGLVLGVLALLVIGVAILAALRYARSKT